MKSAILSHGLAFVAVAIFLCCPQFLNSQPAVQWRKAYLGSEDAVAYSVGQGGDDGFICGGWIGQDGLFLRVREDGSPFFENRYAGRRVNKVLVDGWSYMVGGDSANSMFFANAGIDGTLSQIREFPGVGRAQAWDFIKYINRYWLVGHTEDTTRPGELDAFVIESDWQGNVLTRIVYGGEGDSDLRAVVENNWGVWFAGWTVFGGAHHSWTIRWRGGGNWSGSPWAVSEWNDFVGIIGGQHLVRVGHTLSDNQKDVYVSRCGEIGSYVWNYIQQVALDQDARSVVIGHDGGFVVAGYTENGTDKDILFFRLNNDGTLDWETTLPMQGDEIAEAVEKTDDGGYVICGSWTPPGVGHRSPLLIKLCPPGSDAGRMTAIAFSDAAVGYRLTNESGSLDEVRIWGIDESALAWASGSAETNWHASWQNDTLRFTSAIPLTTDSIDTLWVSRAATEFYTSWQVGCRIDTCSIWTGEVEVLTFTGYPIGNEIELALTVQEEAGVDRYEFYGISSDSTTSLIEHVDATNDVNSHSYTIRESAQFVAYRFAAIDVFGSRREFAEWGIRAPLDISPQNPVVTQFSLPQNYPNPFNATTEIQFALPRAAEVVLNVYDVTGRLARTIANGKFAAGEHRVSFDATGLASGVYFYQLRAGDTRLAKKMLLLK